MLVRVLAGTGLTGATRLLVDLSNAAWAIEKWKVRPKIEQDAKDYVIYLKKKRGWFRG